MESHTPVLINDLAIVLMCAAGVTLLFKRLKLPVFLGYLLSGFLVGPNLWERSPVHDLETIQALSELGVVFLMFSLGLEFDLRRLRQVLGPAMLAIILQTLLMLFIGSQAAPLMGLGVVQGLFLGSILAISSSMVTVAILKELGRWQKPHAQLAVGVLILEDILAIALLVILSGVAVTGALNWAAVGGVTFLICLFVVFIYFVGKLAAPRLLDALERHGSSELITICVVALMLGLCFVAELWGLSVALGAFLAGSILSQTSLTEQIEHSTEPLRNVFCAVFFVSAGMLINPETLWDNALVIILLTLAMQPAKVISVWLGFFLAGQRTETSFRAATVKSQIGEFSFIIAALGQQLGVTDASLMSIAVGVSVLSTGGSIVLAKNSDPLHAWLARRLPRGLSTLAEFYRNLLDGLGGQAQRTVLLKLVKRPLLQILFNFLLLNAFLLIASVASNQLGEYIEEPELRMLSGLAVWLLAGLIALPFVTAMIRNLSAIVMMITDTMLSTGATRSFIQGRMRNIFNGAIVVAVVLLVGGIYLSVAAQYLPSGTALAAFLLLILLAAVFFWNRIIRINSQLEYMFMESFNQRVVSEEKSRRDATLEAIEKRYPWPVSVEEVTVPPGGKMCGRTLREANLRAATGASAVALARAGQVLYDLDPDEIIFPGDHWYLFGNHGQIRDAVRLFTAAGSSLVKTPAAPDLRIEKLYVTRESQLVDETLASAELRQKHGVTVLGIQRGEHRITNPPPEEIIHAQDVLYVVGETSAIEALQAIESADDELPGTALGNTSADYAV
ncbi:cation:proton antiporter [Cerasicoccus fimbriatus]|uniref:cation:proton antiporter domain-containing protein n=1 Tax=Cerasicoccus fimbriatus TaxID=3014554 RepID=UPI0022B50229|nr:cation:proton antiporter [Cerasicoccus sp. TK19100]